MLQIYTGDGKGKTTAAIGLTVRAVGAGLKVYIMQFMKSLYYSEQKMLLNMKNVTLKTTGKPFFIAEEGMLTDEQKAAFGTDVVIFPKDNPPKDYVAEIKSGLETAVTEAQNADVVILDEINVALFFGLITREEVETAIAKLNGKEIICTGRRAPRFG